MSAGDVRRKASRPTHALGVATALVLGAYIAQKLQRPFGLQGDNDRLLFLLFSIAVMVAIYAVVVAAATARQRAKARD